MAGNPTKAPGTSPDSRRTPGVIPEVYAKHLAEFQFLWQQRQGALRSPDFTLPDVAQRDARIAAHLDGLLVAGESTLPVLEEALAGGDPAAVFAAAYVLLSLKIQAAADRVVESLLTAEAEKLDALRQSLCQGPIDLIEGRLRAVAASAPGAPAAAALEALTFHRRPDPAVDRLVEFVQDQSAQVRRIAWRITALLTPPSPAAK